MEQVTLKLTYFKASGKYYSEGELKVDKNLDWGVCLELVDFHFRGACLPGLNKGSSGFIVHVTSEDHPKAFPAIITNSLKKVSGKINSL
ncbi:hypothetical protein [Moellerella wisconsensis]|uniref:Uncharacterized protein n=1 Tax=Moellerella wisconsensis TaxID=158849 RepID=A0ACD3YD63_9GAMM|nr:hypothetical protein [Moellerella wisconsensis]KLN95699.1 hypothetical protein VK86_14420 [Moellerella wisconsensis]UNH29258.1 hypothetical protein MNY64_18170 [Moellerella wisconsensis]UNH40935.1 hypothetical protein MNY70_18390 [Moellerella wisconsensis]